ncbi:MAG TPA: HDOD domain-containing protein [Opitutaceae bacterium]|nr:HDOD domain-containing protein [Opitutaceae bacterium]
MSVLLLRCRSWWSRFLRRPKPVRVPVFYPPADTRPAVSARTPRENPPPLAESSAAAPVAVEAATDATQSLLETLQISSLASHTAVAARPLDPAVRERTLAGLENLRQIPALQSLAQGFMRALNRPEVSVDEVVETIEKDSALCVRVLRMANSVLISPEHRIEDLETAVHMLGVVRVRKAAQALFTLRDANRVAEGFDWKHLWVHALATADIAEELEQQLRSADNSQIYLAALLHDVGKIVLSTLAPDDYRDVLVTAWNDNGRLEDLERARLGVDHREAGVMFARHNQLPAIVVEAIAHHDRPEEATAHRFEVALIALANYLSKAHGLGFSGARLDATDGEFEELSAWKVIEEELGGRPNVEGVAAEMKQFIGTLRAELRELREGL